MASSGEGQDPGTSQTQISAPKTEVRREGSDRFVNADTVAAVDGRPPFRQATADSTVGRGKSSTRSVIEACEAELATGPDAPRRARLHYNIARELEESVARLDQAREHYAKALEASPEYLPAIRGARRCCIADGQFSAALPFFEAELKMTSDPRARAMLHYAHGRLLEDFIGDFDGARNAYRSALKLDSTNATILKALERVEILDQRWTELADVLHKTANAITEDSRHRATLLTERARLLERSGKSEAAGELYLNALHIDENHPGPVQALDRLFHQSKNWRYLVELFERLARKTNDRTLSALYLRRAARLQAEKLGSEADAMNALASAMELLPQEPLILDELAPMYQDGERIVSLAEVLRQQILTASDAGEQAALLHSLGHIYELLAHDKQAIACFENALEIDPSYSASLKALDRLYARYENWEALIRVHVREAGFTEDAERGADAHVRAAVIYEERLRDRDSAIDHFGRALARVPLHEEAFKALVRLYRHGRRFRDLVELYDRGAQLATDPPHVIALLFQAAGVWEDALEDPGRAAALYRRIIEHDPSNLSAVQGLQRVTERSGQYRELITALRHELELGANRSRTLAIHHRIGTVLSDSLDDPSSAVDHFRKMLEVDPTSPAALSALGRIFRSSGRWEELLDVYQRELIRARDPRRAAALLYKMGELCERCLGRDEEAITNYRKALEHDDSYRPALRALAQQLRRQRSWTELIEALVLEAEGAADSRFRALGWYRVGEVYEYHLSDPDKAARAYELALAAVPDHRPTLAALSRLRHQRGDWHSLLAELVTEIELTDDESRKVTLALQRGLIYRDELNDYDKAIACFEAVLPSELGHLPALLALEVLYPKIGDFDKLARTYRSIADATGDRQAKITALRELARVMGTRGVGTRQGLVDTYNEILKLVPGDLFTLERLGELARSTGDPALSEKVSLQLAEAADSPNLRAHYLTGLAAAMEAQDNHRAIEVYRRALEENKEQLAAVRGMARLASSLGDALALADASRMEAEQTSDPKIAAQLYLRSATLRLEQPGATSDGLQDLRRSLELYPEFRDAAEALTRALSKANRREELVDDLSAAARACKSRSRSAELWLQVAGLQASMGLHTAGISSLQRGLGSWPTHVPSLRALADLHQQLGQWREAVAALERVLESSKERDLFSETQLQLASLWDEHLDDFERAKECVRAVLERHNLHHGAMSRQASYLVRDKKLESAANLLRRLIADSREPDERADGLIRLAKVEDLRGDERAGEEALKEALTIQGPGKQAADVYRKRSELQGSWVGYSAALATYLRDVTSGGRERPEAQELVAAYLDLARAYDAGMGLAKKAIETLADGVKNTEGDAVLSLELAERLRNAGQIQDSMRRLTELLARDATQARAWGMLGELMEATGRRDEARYAHHPLHVLEVEGRGTRSRARVLAAPISIDVVHALAPENATTSPAAALLAASADAAGKLFPPTLERYGLSRRDRITSRSGHPLREAADRIAEIFTVDEFDFYVHSGTTPLLSVELTEPAAIVVSKAAGRLSGSQQAFLLSYAMASLAARFFPALRLSARELELLLAASSRAISESVSSPLATDSVLYEHAQTVKKAVPRRWRRAFELAASDFARTRINVAHWQQSLLHTAIRSALIVCDDLKSGIKVLRRMHSMPDLRGPELVASSRTVADLMRFWVSEDAFRARRQCGIIKVPTPPPRPPGM